MLSISIPVLLALAGLPDVPDVPDTGDEVAATLAAPVRLLAGGQPMGNTQLYPSPTLHDLDGDGIPEMIVGDLFGNLMVSKRIAGDDLTAWTEAEKLEGADGKVLKFNNW